MSWEATIERPKPEQLTRVGAPTWEVFLQAGRIIAETIDTEIKEYFGKQSGKPRVLDFGAGVGRVFLPLFFQDSFDLLGTDIDESAVEYLRRVTRRANIHQNAFSPPSPFASNSFDCVYSVSIWTHLPPAAQIPWLQDIARVLKSGGLALISTCGYRSLHFRHKRGDEAWLGVTEDDLRLGGILFREYKNLRSHAHSFPGVTASYGSTLHDPEYIRREWSKVMEILAVQEAAIAKSQDLIVMVKR